ncbi:MAG: M24 family metallopeptidase [Dehalococcoidia bacterium]
MMQYSLGHGVGLRCCELPIIYRPEMMATVAQLEESMVVCLEPEKAVESRGETVVVKVEDMFLVTSTGLGMLTTTAYPSF